MAVGSAVNLGCQNATQQALNQAPSQSPSQLQQYIGGGQATLHRVWLIVPDNHTEGLGEPVAAYRNKLDADRAMELLAHTHRAFKVVELSVW